MVEYNYSDPFGIIRGPREGTNVSSVMPVFSIEDYGSNRTTVNNTQPPPPSAMRVCLWAICILGIALNLLVFRRNNYSRKRQNSSVRNSLQLLCFMATADTISLAALMLALSTQYLGVNNYFALATICKVDLFLIHAASAFSIWCWLILSAMRYLAIYHPYSHLKLNKEPIFTTAMILVMCGVLELWILYDVTFIEDLKICGETLPDEWGKGFQLAEIIWSYFLPLTLITILDLKVLCCHSTWYSKARRASSTDLPALYSSENISTAMGSSLASWLKSGRNTASMNSMAPLVTENSVTGAITAPMSPTAASAFIVKPIAIGKNSSSPRCFMALKEHFPCSPRSSPNQSCGGQATRRRTQQMRILRRCLCISILDLGMNLPNYLVRLYLTLVPDESLEQVASSALFLWIQDISQLLYFAQFSLNALYLVCIIYVSGNRSVRRTGST